MLDGFSAERFGIFSEPVTEFFRCESVLPQCRSTP